MPGAQFFPEGKINYAENMLRYVLKPENADKDAILFWGEDKVKRRLKNGELAKQIAKLAAHFKMQGMKMGDRIAAFIPNMPESGYRRDGCFFDGMRMVFLFTGFRRARGIGSIWAN